MRSSIYDDIIHLPHHVSTKHPQMTLLNRAAQFSPFAALATFESTIIETRRLTDEEISLTEDAAEILDRKLCILLESISEQPPVIITFFQPDAKKVGGEYVCISGNIRKIDLVARILALTNGEEIRIDDIYEIESPLVEAML